ncbi:MAG: efflux RND transporter periplasmic adaptor subunit [Zoogloeaceae bacterium]|nr:efflux RND transporter periplasmic adaptor subunit [Zoogloeaceae bacterium]
MPAHNNKARPRRAPQSCRPVSKLLPLLVSGAVLLSACSSAEAPPGQQQPTFFQGLLMKLGLGEAPPPAAPPALPVTVLDMRPQTVPYALEVMAQTEGAKETEVRARVGGILTKQLYQEGQPVKAGQPLFQIDRETYEIAYSEAKARAEQTERERARMEKLLPLQGVSRKEFDDADSANKLAQAALRQAELNLSWSTVTAPVAGISGRADKSVGNLISVGADSLLTAIYQNNPMWVRFSLSESEIAKLPGGKLTPQTVTGVELVLPDGAVYAQKGKLNFLASSIDTVLGTRQLRAEFTNPDNALLPGQFVRARLLAGARQGVYLLPQSAVLQTEQGDLVMTVTPDNTVAPRPVQTGEWLGKDWIILGGLNPGDRVIIDNLMKLRPGAPVAPHAPQAPGAAPGAPADKAEAAPAKQG